MDRICQLILIFPAVQKSCFLSVAQKPALHDHDRTFHMQKKIIIAICLRKSPVLFSKDIAEPFLQDFRQRLKYLAAGHGFFMITVLMDADHKIRAALFNDLAPFFHICHFFPAIRI